MKSVGLTNLGFEYGEVHDEIDDVTKANGVESNRKCAVDSDLSDKHPLIEDVRYKVFKTVFMVLGPCAMGIYLELSGPTLIDLKASIGADYEEIARVLVARSVGYLVGALVGGLLADVFTGHLEILLSFAFYLGALGTGLIIWCPNIWSMGIMFHFQGLGEGLIDTVNNVLCIRMWGKDAAPPIHALHFGFGCGAILAPQLARPFISSRETLEDTLVDGAPPSQIAIPYTISSIFTFFFCLAFAAFYFFERNYQRKNAITKPDNKRNSEQSVKHYLRDLFSPGSCTDGRTIFGIIFFALMFMLYMNIVGGERAVSKFLYSYAIKKSVNHFDKTSASTLNSVFWLCFTAGRGITIVVSRWVKPDRMMWTELAGNIVSVTLLLLGSLWAAQSNTALWAGVCMLGLSLSPVFPTALAWINLHVTVSGMAVAWVFAGSAAGGAVYQWLTGYLFEYHGPITLMYVLFGYAWVLTVVFLLLAQLVRFMGKRKEAEVTSIPSKSTAAQTEVVQRSGQTPSPETRESSAQAFPWELKMNTAS